jgi:hypothetical protein
VTDSPPDPSVLFLSHLPRIVAHAAFALRHVPSPDAREDLEAEVVALAWKWFARLTARGRHPEQFVTTLALRCSQAVRAGRRLASPERARDVLSPVAKARHGVVVEELDDVEAVALHLSDAMAADTRTPVPRQVAFRIDFPAWRAGFVGRTRAVLDALVGGERTTDVARRFGVSPPRVVQYRRAFQQSWADFHSRS